MALCFFAAGALAQDALLPEETAYALARSEFLKATGLDESKLTGFMFLVMLEEPETGKPQYLCRARYIHAMGMSYVLTLDAYTGELLTCTADKSVREQVAYAEGQDERDSQVKAATALWEKKLGASAFWDYRDKYAFYAQYGSLPGERAEDIPSDCALPNDTDLSYEQALVLARERVRADYGASDERLDALKLDATFHDYAITDNEEFSRVWRFLYRAASPDESGAYPIVYQADVFSPSGASASYRAFTVKDFMALGFNQITAENLTELGALCYVPNGGRFFHIDRDCPGVMPEDKPMTEFLTGLLESEPYKSLLPCPRCVPQ